MNFVMNDVKCFYISLVSTDLGLLFLSFVMSFRHWLSLTEGTGMKWFTN